MLLCHFQRNFAPFFPIFGDPKNYRIGQVFYHTCTFWIIQELTLGSMTLFSFAQKIIYMASRLIVSLPILCLGPSLLLNPTLNVFWDYSFHSLTQIFPPFLNILSGTVIPIGTCYVQFIFCINTWAVLAKIWQCSTDRIQGLQFHP